MPSHSDGPGIWLSVWRFLLTHCLYERAAEVLARLRGCAGSPEPSLLAYAISTKFAWRGPFVKHLHIEFIRDTPLKLFGSVLDIFLSIRHTILSPHDSETVPLVKILLKSVVRKKHIRWCIQIAQYKPIWTRSFVWVYTQCAFSYFRISNNFIGVAIDKRLSIANIR